LLALAIPFPSFAAIAGLQTGRFTGLLCQEAMPKAKETSRLVLQKKHEKRVYLTRF